MCKIIVKILNLGFLNLILLQVMACSTQGTNKNLKSPLSYLHGKHYRWWDRVTINNLHIPLGLKEKTVIFGQLISLPAYRVLPQQVIQLRRDGDIIAETRTDVRGRFQWEVNIEHGDYLIFFENESYSARRPLKIDQYEIGPIEILAQLKSGSS